MPRRKAEHYQHPAEPTPHIDPHPAEERPAPPPNPRKVQYIPIVVCPLIDANGRQAPFSLSFYGIPLSEFLVSPGGGTRIMEALERRGLVGYVSSPFAVYERRINV